MQIIRALFSLSLMTSVYLMVATNNFKNNLTDLLLAQTSVEIRAMSQHS